MVSPLEVLFICLCDGSVGTAMLVVGIFSPTFTQVSSPIPLYV
ncbi:hypothetical protein BC059799_3866 [Bacillus cereus NVH0597-99]|nr:hypothetical protein BC059799_3866 [Bacillus cereus NVH0597-99]